MQGLYKYVVHVFTCREHIWTSWKYLYFVHVPINHVHTWIYVVYVFNNSCKYFFPVHEYSILYPELLGCARIYYVVVNSNVRTYLYFMQVCITMCKYLLPRTRTVFLAFGLKTSRNHLLLFKPALILFQVLFLCSFHPLHID